MTKNEFRKDEFIEFIKEWTDIVERLKRSRVDLSKIKLISEVE